MNDAILLVVLTVLATLLAERVIKRTLVHLAVAGFMRWLSRRAEEAERKQAAEVTIWLRDLGKALFWRAAWEAPWARRRPASSIRAGRRTTKTSIR